MDTKLQALVTAAISLAMTSGCQATREPTEYVIATGNPIEFQYADWTFDFCAAANESRQPGEGSCVQVGGEVYKGEFANLKVLAGHLPVNTKYVGVVGHALKKDQRNAPPMLLVLKRSIPELLQDTGLEYFTIDRRTVSKHFCFQEKLEVVTGLKLSRLRYTGMEGGAHCYDLK